MNVRRPTRITPLALFLMFAGWALLLTWPLALHPLTAIPRGDEPASTVPLFNLWTLQWNIDQLTHGYPTYWNAPIFAPLSGTFAFSEIQPLTALLAAPLWLALQSPAAGYNFALLLFLTLNGWFAFWLLREWDVPPAAALPGGLLMQTLPFVAQEMGVLQLTALFGILWSMLFISRFLRETRTRRAVRRSTTVGLALGVPVTFFTCGYYGLFSLFFLPPAFAVQLHPRRWSNQATHRLLTAGVLALLLTAPLLWLQYSTLRAHQFNRSATTITNNSAQWADYAKVLDGNLLYSRFWGWASPAGQRLFPGAGLLLLAAAGLAGRARRRVKLYLLAAAALALLLSLGLRLEVAGWQPYQWIRDWVPGFRQLRSPFRFAAIVQLHLALLAGFGLASIQRWFVRGRLISAGVTGLVLLEMLALPLPLLTIPQPAPNADWQAWLNRQAAPPVVVMVPFAASARAGSFEQTVGWMLESRYFQGRMVNGYSGFFPPHHRNLRRQMRDFPSSRSIVTLHNLRTNLVIVHHTLPGAPSAERVAQFLQPVFTDTENGVTIYQLP